MAPMESSMNRSNIPAELKLLNQWVGWSWTKIGEKWTKVPYDLKTGANASSSDPSTWGSYTDTEGHDLIGFMFSEDDPFCGVDLDKCLDPETGEVTEEAWSIVRRLGSYAEISPSGTGVKIFLEGRIPGPRRKNPGKNIEVYDRLRFFTVTGNRLQASHTEIRGEQEDINRLYEWLFPQAEPLDMRGNGYGGSPNTDLSDEDILSRAYRAANGEKFMRLWNGNTSDYGSHSEADLALCSMLAFWTGPDPERIERMFADSGLSRGKWSERPAYRKKTVAKALSDMTEFYSFRTGATIRIGGEPQSEADNANLAELPVELPEAADFPVEALPESCQRFIREGAKARGVPTDLIALPVLAVLSAGIGGSRMVEMQRSHREGAALFLSIVAPPGQQKSPAAAAALAPLKDRQKEYISSHRERMDRYEEKERNWKVRCKEASKNGDPEPEPPEKPILERTAVDDATVEALVDILKDNPRGVIMEKDELTGWVRSMDQYKAGGKGSDRQHWLSMWSNKTIIVDRKSQDGIPIYVDRPWVTLFGGIQPARLPEIGGSIEDGLLDRFLFGFPEDRHEDYPTEDISYEAEQEYATLYASLAALSMPEDIESGARSPRIVPMSHVAKDRYRGIYNTMGKEMREPGFPGRLRGAWAKMRGYVLRLSLILAVARSVEDDEPEQVEAEDIENALQLMEYFQGHARKVYGVIGAVTQEDLLAGEIKSFLLDEDGSWGGEPKTFFDRMTERDAQGIPKNTEWLTRMLKSIVSSSPQLVLDDKNRWIDGQSKRWLQLEYGVNGVNGVKESRAE